MTTNPLKPGTHVCRECGIDLAPLGLKKSAVFCKAEHRKDWNNRRMVRGAELYDLFMEKRYDRDTKEARDAWTIMSNLALAYRSADKKRRNGRKSWNAKETVARLPLAFGEDGDHR